MWLRCRRKKKKYTAIVLLAFACSCLIYMGILNLTNAIINSYRNSQKARSQRQKMGPHVIVAHYIGSGNLFGNFSKDVLNQNYFSPVPGEGDDGKPVIIPAREILKMQHLFQVNRFNLLASDRIPLNRSLPDVRKKKCITKKYPNQLPDTSIIIVFHNEAWSVLLRTVWSVINRSPKHLIREILLVDDASDRDFLKGQLDEYVAGLPVKTRVLRQSVREGLVPARLLGARNATGKVLTFLDAHCECSIGWLEPMLARISENRKKVVCPVIDIISDDNFGYIKSFELHWGAFNWQLHFRWYLLGTKELSKRKLDIIAPFSTPVMAGGLFAIDKEYFYEIGSYDSKMKIWGGDNLEISFRLWQCGGEIEIVPCSHVGHLFRKSSPYTFPGGVNEVLNENLARTALVWMDEWANFFFKYQNIAKSDVVKLDVTDRLELRKTLQCKSFNWYLSNIWTDHFFPTDDRFFGKIILADANSEIFDEYLNVLSETDLSKNLDWTYLIDYLNNRIERVQEFVDSSTKTFCMQKPQNQGVLSLPFGRATLKQCSLNDNRKMNELFVIKADGHIMTDEGICLDSTEKSREDPNAHLVRIVTCAHTNQQKWFYNIQTQQIVQNSSDFCLTGPPALLGQLEGVDATDSSDKFNITLSACTTNKLQRWMLIPLNWKEER